MCEGVDWLNHLDLFNEKKILCLVDGEHYPPVTEWAVEKIREKGGSIAGLVFLGGTEKIGDSLDQLFNTQQYPLFANTDSTSPLQMLKEAVKKQSPDLVVDLSDDPVVDYQQRFRMASLLLSQQVTYAGADFLFRPPARKPLLEKPSIAIIGTGKRIGKTAVSITTSRILKQQGRQPAVIAMGRGGPAEPVVVDTREQQINPDYLLQVVQEGKHAASDYWENAILADIPAIGCRRCGGGMAGNPFITNVAEGVRIANGLPVDLVIMEGSGPTFPPVQTDSKLLVVGAHQPLEQVTGYLDEYRLLEADLVVVTMCEEPSASPDQVKTLYNRIRNINPKAAVALTIFRPEPMGELQDKNVFLATTAPREVIPKVCNYLQNQYQCKVIGYSTHLSNRKALREDLQKEISKADVLLTEIKAASIDVAAKSAKNHQLETIFMHNRPHLVGGTVENLQEAILRL